MASEIKMANGQRDISNELQDYTKLTCVWDDMSRVLNYFFSQLYQQENQSAFKGVAPDFWLLAKA